MTKTDYIEIFNAMITGTPISFKDRVFPMVSEYLTEINYENYQKLISLIGSNPQLAERFIPELVEYYCRKYNIASIKINAGGFNNLKTILYYE